MLNFLTDTFIDNYGRLNFVHNGCR